METGLRPEETPSHRHMSLFAFIITTVMDSGVNRPFKTTKALNLL